jgi:tetratricopeptide (TPR) repeat protein
MLRIGSFRLLAGSHKAGGVSLRALALAAAIGLGGVALGAAPALAETAEAVASEMNGFGRIVLNFPQPVKTVARSSNGVLVIEFDRPVDVAIDRLALEAPAYLAVARRDPDRRALRFALTRPFTVDLKEAGERVFIDLLPPGWSGMPPGLPQDVVQELARRAIVAEEKARAQDRAEQRARRRVLGVRTARAPTFDRIVFEAEIVVPVDYKREGDSVTMTFDAALRADLPALRTTLAGLARDIEAEVGEASLILSFNVPAGREIKTFREDDSFILDLVDGEAERRAKAEAEARAAQSETAIAPSPAAASESAPPAAGAPASTPSAEARLRKADDPLAALLDASEAGPVDDGPVVGVLTEEAGASVIDFSFGERPAAAAFLRDGGLWLVIDSRRPITPPALGEASARRIGRLGVETVGDAQVIRAADLGDAVASLAATPTGWRLRVGDGFAAPATPLRLLRSVSAEGRSVVAARLPGAGRTLWLDNDTTGERYAVVVSPAAPHSLPKEQRFVEFAALQTLHGMVVRPIADDIAVTSGLDEVVIGRSEGLAVSQDPRPADATRGADALLVDAATWTDDAKGAVLSTERTLFAEAAAAPMRERADRRHRLARFQLANALATEAKGVLLAMMQDDAGLLADKRVLLSLAMAQAMGGDGAAARKTLALPPLAEEPEARIWEGYLDMRDEAFGPALVSFRKGLTQLDLYPDALQAMLRPMVVQAAIEANDGNFAAQQLDLYQRLGHADGRRGLADLLRGRLAELDGRVDDAIALYAVAARSDDRWVEANGRLRAALIGLREGRGDAKAHEAELETVALIWRRDHVELTALEKLSELYAASARWQEAFATTRRALEISPDHAITRRIQDQMSERFEELFLTDKADEIDRVKALALYYDFRNFTPVGRKGDDIVRRLADRLIELDLLAEAAELLRHQVDNRLTGVARSSVAAKLAVVYLQDRKPVDAIEVLRTTRLATIPADLKRSRTLLEARALAELSRTDLAIEMLAAMEGEDVLRLRADILWSGKRWKEAGEAFEEAAGDIWRDRTAALSPQQQADVLRAGIAYVLSAEPLSLSRLRTKFADQMAATSDARAFQIVSSEAEARPGDFREIVRSAISSETLAEFLRAYRARYPEQAGPEPAPEAPPAAEGQGGATPEAAAGSSAALDPEPTAPADASAATPPA